MGMAAVGRRFIGDLNLTDLPGQDRAEVIPTVRGQYQVRLSGLIGARKIDELVEPAEVLSLAILEFPETQPDAIDLQRRLETLESPVEIAFWLSIAAAVVAPSAAFMAAVNSRNRRE